MFAVLTLKLHPSSPIASKAVIAKIRMRLFVFITAPFGCLLNCSSSMISAWTAVFNLFSCNNNRARFPNCL